MPLESFKASLQTDDAIAALRAGLIGEGVEIPGLDGPVRLVYADYVASGRALRQVEDFVAEQVLPYYANSHTEASWCGSYMTRLRAEARAEIARLTRAGEDCAVIFAGSGATAGLNRLVTLLGVEKAETPVVFIGPYEHHSNILPWRESRATVVEIPEGEGGGPDLAALEAALEEHAGADLKIGSFSAASNVTGIVTDDIAVTRLLKRHSALSVWDYAGGGPYLEMDMGAGEIAKDAIVVSPHKFPGGPGASGVLVLRKSAVARARPSWPGGGTVSFVSPWSHSYTEDLAAREEAGTPNIIGDIRAALVFLVKEAVGQERLDRREDELNAMAKAAWLDHPQLTLLGCEKARRLPIFSFLVRDGAGQPVHQQLFTRMLSDLYGIQTRGGCACAGPYAHRLLGIDRAASEQLHRELRAGHELEKPGWIRLNFTALMDDVTARYIITSVLDLLARLDEVVPRYQCDPSTARFKAVA
ncbi:aminotransferase class V-fold PLP-dependent enzyme [Tropicimonas sp. TH_r6]|uniref:aminotransferase class V-fold PLP-dependent enzyme n=1 Tax=Tropicimonas sp. TH_r6 TaxID=3082085 RepID=UPI002954A690|nr:aminotransferase class V-fold PLP-dependent enzyme [Tropicimonas sp. TH_r6]MDV7143302.1 aminotransferase class V-fold PLP-dependent enzyme [Tropicimonas sp. TH_r6]